MWVYSTDEVWRQTNSQKFSIKTRHWYCDLYKMTFFFQLLDGKYFQSKGVKALFYGKTWFRWNIFMNTFSNIGAYQEIGQTKYMPSTPGENICSSGHGHTAPRGLPELSTWTEGGFSQVCKGFCPAVAKHNIHMSLTHTAMSVQVQNQGSPGCWYHLCSLAQHLLGQGEWRPSIRHKKPLMWVLHVNPLSTGCLWYSSKSFVCRPFEWLKSMIDKH